MRHYRGEVCRGNLEGRWGGSMEQLGSNRHIPFRRKSVADIPDVMIDPEGFLENEQPGMWAAFPRTSHIGCHPSAVLHCQFHFLGHNICMIHLKSLMHSSLVLIVALRSVRPAR